MASRFWAGGPSSEEESDSEVEIAHKQLTRAASLWGVESDSGSDDDVRVVKSAKDKALEGIKEACSAIKNHITTNDWTKILAEFDALGKHLNRAKTVLQAQGYPTFYVRTMVQLEDFLHDKLKGKADQKRMSRENRKALVRMRGKLKKHLEDSLQTEMDKFRANPVESSASEASSDESSEESSDDDDDDDDDVDLHDDDDSWSSQSDSSDSSDSEEDGEVKGRAKWLEQARTDKKAKKGPRISRGSRPSAAAVADELLDDDDTSGFLTANAEHTYGSSSIWLDPALLDLRLDLADVAVSDNHLSSAIETTTRIREGTYRGEQVTVKRLGDTVKTIDNAAAFAATCKAFRDLKHPNLVLLTGLTWHKAVDIQVITPYAPRGSLRELLNAPDVASLTWSDFKCQVAIDIASALAYLHQQGLAAGLGGLTSHDVVLSIDKQDRWVAKLDLLHLPCRDVAAAQDRVPSPLRWLAPEVILGGDSSTESADMYALGVLLTELDTTKTPFLDAVNPNGEQMDDMLIAMRVVKCELRPDVSSECPDAIADLVAKCLSHDPSERPSAGQAEYQLRVVWKDL